MTARHSSVVPGVSLYNIYINIEQELNTNMNNVCFELCYYPTSTTTCRASSLLNLESLDNAG